MHLIIFFLLLCVFDDLMIYFCISLQHEKETDRE